MSAAVVHAASAAPAAPLYRVSVAQLHAALAAGGAPRETRSNSSKDSLVERAPKNPPHVVALGNAADLLAECLPSGWTLRTRDSITLAEVRGLGRNSRSSCAAPRGLCCNSRSCRAAQRAVRPQRSASSAVAAVAAATSQRSSVATSAAASTRARAPS